MPLNARDEQGNPSVVGSIFGPKLNEDGSIDKAGGFALFANVRQLMDSGLLRGGKPVDLYPVMPGTLK